MTVLRVLVDPLKAYNSEGFATRYSHAWDLMPEIVWVAYCNDALVAMGSFVVSADRSIVL